MSPRLVPAPAFLESSQSIGKGVTAMFPLSKGQVAKQAHVGLPDGTYEEEHGREAFDGRASHLYRTH